MKLLAVGDMHLGRVPVALPPGLADAARSLGPETAWQRCIDKAISLKVEAVLLAGDVVDRERDFFAGYASLKSGIESLLEHDIRVIAVAGNHDTEVLPRLADALPGLELLGRGGEWESIELSAGSVIGWSFPGRRVTRSPLETFPRHQPTRPSLGLLHCDRDQTDSAYAPVRSAELEAAEVDAWLLGHVHQPDLMADLLDGPGGTAPQDRRHVVDTGGYLGSVSALRASETGARGPWLIEVEHQAVTARQLALAPLAYDALDLEVSTLEQAGDLDGAMLAAGKQRIVQRIDCDALPDALGLRFRLTGLHPAAREIAEAARRTLEQQPVFEESGCQVFIDKIESAISVPLDLEALAGQPDPAGVIARDLLLLAGPDCEDRRRLIADARSRMQAAAVIPELQPVATEISAEQAGERLLRVGRAVLARLLETRR
ncbi:MAG TPA: metallophosphoesterase [Wenzhouxiangellaceae bacterium]|nr:metallophosphoesterase [Wenzhouxiangellaceae bacterium]